MKKSFGITVHYIDEGIDTGDIILQKFYQISDNDDYNTLLQTARTECANLLCQALEMMLSKDFKTTKQSSIDKYGFYCTQRKIGDGIINWDQTAREIFNLIRAIIHPGPIARTTLKDKEMKISRAIYHLDAPNYKCINGAIVGLTSNGF